MITATPEKGERVASAEELETSLSVLDLVPASPEFGTQQVKNRLASNPSAAQSDCAVELAATMGRLLAAASSAPGTQRGNSKVANESSPAFTSSSPATRVGPAISTAMWSGVSARVLRTTRESMAAAGVMLRHWQLGFSHDWKATVNAMNFSQMKKSLTQWLRQPTFSKPMGSSKNQTV